MSSAKISAFAKRRRLNNGSAVEAPASDSSASSNAKTKNVITPKKTRKHKTVQVTELLIVAPASDPEVSLGENSFEPLVEAQAVKFTGIREIENVGISSYKVRLSRGQECSFIGVVKLWVRDGSIEVYGANLHESSRIHTVFAPHIHGGVRIKSVSKTAEFQLESIKVGDSTAPSSLNLPGGIKLKRTDLSFHIIDFEEHSTGHYKQTDAVARLTGHHDDRFKPLLKQLISVKGACVLVAGKRSSNTACASVKLINAVLSDPIAYGAENGIALLDLDQLIPTHTTPGTVSLVYEKGFLLGPAYAYPLYTSTENSVLVSSIYTGCMDDDGGVEILKIIKDMLKSYPEMRKMPLVVRTGKWLATASASTLSNLRKVLSPSVILSVDRTKSSPFYEAAVAISEKECVLEHIPEFAIHAVPSLTEHRYKLRSHFMFQGYVDGVPKWHQNISKSSEAHELELSIGSGISQLRFLLISGGIVRPDDLADMLTSSLVTLVAREPSDSDQGSGFQIQPFQQNLNLRYIGIAFAESLDETSDTIRLITSITDVVLERYRAEGLALGLVLERPGSEGQFSRYMLRD